MVQSEPRSHMEYVNFEPSQYTILEILQDFHVVRAVKGLLIYEIHTILFGYRF
jgi:hypothetical protein